MYRLSVVSVLLGVFGLAGCGSSSPTDASGVAVTVSDPDVTLMHQGYSGFNVSQRLVVRDADTWAAVWATAFELQTPMPPVPAVDFSREMVLVVALGARPTGGYDIAIHGLVVEPGGVRVLVTATAPSDDCVTTQAVTQPVMAVRVRAMEGSVEFQDRSQTHTCG